MRSREYSTEKSMETWKRMHFKRCKGAKNLDKTLFKKGAYTDWVTDANVGKGTEKVMVSCATQGIRTNQMKNFIKGGYKPSKPEKKLELERQKLPIVNTRITDKDDRQNY